MTTHPDDVRTPALLLSSETTHHDRPLLSLRLDLVYFNGDNELRNYNAGGILYNDAEGLADLRITAQYDVGISFNHDPYGWHTEYRDAFSVNLRRAEAMVKTLRKLDRGLARLDEKWGNSDTFAAYVIRVATVLKIGKYGYRTDERASGTYSELSFRWGDANTLRYKLNDLVAEFDKKYGPQTVPS